MVNTKKKLFRIALGVIFLFNPNITVVDIFPDFIGCLLIISGLSSLRDVSDSLENARLNFLRLFWISLSHIPAFMLMIFISSSFVSEKTSILVFAFVYAVVEFFLINNALTSLIDGFVYVGERYDGDCCFYEKRKNKKIDVGRLRLFTTVFLLVTKSLSVAPNLLYLYDTSHGYGTVLSPYAVNPVEFIGPATAVCFIPAFVFGVVWAVRMFSYVKGISADQPFLSRVDEILSNKALQDTAVYKYRRISTVICLFISAVVLSVDFYIDEFNVIPDVVCGLILLSCVFFIRKHFELKSVLPLASCTLYVVCEAVLLWYASYFNVHFKFSDVGRVVEADTAYAVYRLLLIVCEVLFVVSLACLTVEFSKVLKNGFSVAVRAGHVKNGKDEFMTKHMRKSVVAIALAAACSVCHVFYLITLGDMNRVLIDKNSYTTSTGIYMPAIEGFWMVMLAVSVVFIVFVASMLTSSKEELKERLYIL